MERVLQKRDLNHRNSPVRNAFLTDVLSGLTAHPKYLLSKYFYDKTGDELFQKIMACDDYYLTRSELEIFLHQRSSIADAVLSETDRLDVIALGPGDSSKTIHLLHELVSRNAMGKYFPIDISKNVIENLQKKFAVEFPSIGFYGMTGEYFDQLPNVLNLSENRRLVFFVGATIGNFRPNQMLDFCKQLSTQLHKGDRVLIGFDLKKDPRKILAAYNDSDGWTKQFNLNLLTRMNNELGADFQTEFFTHYPTYDPQTGACKSFLISEKKQQVTIDKRVISFEQGEPVYMEISQKYDREQISEAAAESGFLPIASFTDSNGYFLDVIWEVQ